MEREARKKYVARTAAHIGRWIEFTDARQKGTLPSGANLEADAPGFESSVPYAAWLERFYSEASNTEAARHLTPLLQDMRRKCTADHAPFFMVERNPAILRQWRAGRTEDDKGWADAFDYACRLAAQRLYDKTKHLPDGPVEIRVVVNPRDEGLPDKQVTGIRADSERARRWGTHHSYRVIAGEVRGVMQEMECGIDAAKGIVADRRDCSFSRVEKAWLFAQNEEKEETA